MAVLLSHFLVGIKIASHFANCELLIRIAEYSVLYNSMQITVFPCLKHEKSAMGNILQ